MASSGESYTNADARTTIGPVLVALFIQAIETGLIFGQLFTFWSLSAPSGDALRGGSKLIPHEEPYVNHLRAQKLSNWADRSENRIKRIFAWFLRLPNELAVLRIVAIYVVSLAVISHSFSIKYVWSCLVIHWGNLAAILLSNWARNMTQLLTAMLTFPVQCFLIWRCYILTGNNKPLAISFLILAFLSVAAALYTTVRLFLDSNQTKEYLNFTIPYAASIAVSAALTAALTIIISFGAPMNLSSLAVFDVYGIIFLSLCMRIAHDPQTLQVLLAIVWEAGVPPCVCALLLLGLFFSNNNNSNWWYLVFQMSLGQLYVISFFVTVNGFLIIKRKGQQETSQTRPMFDGNGDTQNGGIPVDVTVTVNITRTVEPVDEIGLNITRGLSERLSAARTKTSKKGNSATRSTHIVKLSADSAKVTPDVLEMDEIEDEGDEPIDLKRDRPTSPDISIR